jgi:hypothetical protein
MFDKEKTANESMFFNIDVQNSGPDGKGSGNKQEDDFDPNAD